MNNYGPYGNPPQAWGGDAQPQPQSGQPQGWPGQQPQGWHGEQPQYGSTPYNTQPIQGSGYGGYPPQPPQGPPQFSPPPQPPKQGWISRHPILTVGLFILGVFFVGIALSEGDDSSADASSPDPAVAVASDASDDTSSDDPSGEPSEEPSNAPSGDATEAASAEPTDGPSQTPGTEALSIGDTAHAGNFEFVVSEVETGLESIGDDFLSEEAQGQFVLVEISITNTGDEPDTFYESDQVLIDAEGREHAPDSGAFFYLDDQEGLFLTDINPGNTASGTLVFDIPPNAEPVSITLADSSLFTSEEVTVSLQ